MGLLQRPAAAAISGSQGHASALPSCRLALKFFRKARRTALAI